MRYNDDGAKKYTKKHVAQKETEIPDDFVVALQYYGFN